MPRKRKRRPFAIPGAVQIGPYVYRVSLREGISDAGAYGLCDSRTQTISLDAGLPEDKALDTLLHECLHACSDTYSQGLSEQQVSVLATALVSVVKKIIAANR